MLFNLSQKIKNIFSLFFRQRSRILNCLKNDLHAISVYLCTKCMNNTCRHIKKSMSYIITVHIITIYFVLVIDFP